MHIQLKSLPCAAFIVLAFIATCAAYPKPHARAGDVDGDGSITVKDAVLSFRIAAGLYQPTYEEFLRSDVRPFPYDHRVTPVDGITIARWVFRVPGERMPLDAVLKTSFEIPKTGNAVVNVVLRSGYTVSGHIWPYFFANLATVALSDGTHRYGPRGTDASGLYHINVPRGTYNMRAACSSDNVDDDGSSTITTQAFACSQSVGVTADVYDCDIVIANPTPQSAFRLTVSSANSPLWTPRAICLDGLAGNEVLRDMHSVSVAATVPWDRYTLEYDADYSVGYDFPEHIYLYDLSATDVHSDTAHIFIVPPMVEVHGETDPTVTDVALDSTHQDALAGITAYAGRSGFDRHFSLAAPDGDYVFRMALKPDGDGCYAAYRTRIRKLSRDWTPIHHVPNPPKLRTISGRITDRHGTPLANATVMIETVLPPLVDSDWDCGADVVTDDTGHYTAHIPDGNFTAYVDPLL